MQRNDAVLNEPLRPSFGEIFREAADYGSPNSRIVAALLDRVRRGCFSVTWLVPTGLIPQLVKRVQLETEFFQKHRILKVTVGKECVYKEIAEEITSVSSLEPYFENFVFAFKD